MDTFDLLKEYIINNAHKCWVHDKKEYEEKNEATIYTINRKPRSTECVCDATMRKGTTEFYFAIDEWDDDNNPVIEGITINNINEPYIDQGITITKEYGKITIE